MTLTPTIIRLPGVWQVDAVGQTATKDYGHGQARIHARWTDSDSNGYGCGAVWLSAEVVKKPWRQMPWATRHHLEDGWTRISTRHINRRNAISQDALDAQIDAAVLYLEAALHNAVCDFDASRVRIERHRLSATQGEYSLWYGDRHVGRFRSAGFFDDIQLADRGWQGYTDSHIMTAAEKLYREGSAVNGIVPLCLDDKLAEVAAGRATLMSEDEYRAISPRLPSGTESISNAWRCGYGDERIVGSLDALRAVDPLSAANIEMSRLVDAINAAYPTAGLTLGYIGNVERDGRDDREWRVFSCILDPRKDGHCPGERYSFRLGDLASAKHASTHLEPWVRCVVGLDAWPEQPVRATRGMRV